MEWWMSKIMDGMTPEEREAYLVRRKRRRKRAMYNPQTYWHARGFRYDAPHPLGREGIVLASTIKRYQSGNDNYLEIGSGDGRVFQYLINHGIVTRNSYAACDISRTMIQRCWHKTGLRVTLWDGEMLPYDNAEFEWVLLIHVLLHVPPGDIQSFLIESARVCSRFLYVSTYTGPHEPDAKHCFKHDYLKLFDYAGLTVLRERQIDNEVTHYFLGA
jgi:SAM-dependent methyltransferase